MSTAVNMLNDIFPYDPNRNANDNIVESKDATNFQNLDEHEIIPYRVFFNHVDCFRVQYIASFLTDQIQGALKSPEFGEEGGEEEEDEVNTVAMYKGVDKYEVIGTKQFKFGKVSEDITSIICESDTESFQEKLLQCGFVVYDITQDPNEIPKALAALQILQDEIEKFKEVGPKTFKKYTETRVFILISTVMTWGCTKPIDADDPETPFNESDYKKRKPHPNYVDHIALEREVILRGRKYKDKLKTYVICCGLIYGMEEEDLQFLFKMAWHNESKMPVFFPGKNKIPLIHVQDLARILHGILETQPKKPQYILAVEQTTCSLRQIVKALSKSLGRGQVKEVTQEEAFLYPNITQTLFERYTLNLNMEPGYIVEDLELEYKNELNLAENMPNIVTEFRKACNLIPMKVVLHGPPASGKTTLAKDLVDQYGVHYVSVKSAIDETIENLRDLIALARANILAKEEKEKLAEIKEAGQNEQELEEVEEEEEEDAADIEELEEQLHEIEELIESSENHKLPDEFVVKLMRDILNSNICQNQGYVLDGYPKTAQQANELFGVGAGGMDEEIAEEEDAEGEPNAANKILPSFVISLEATNDFLCEKIMKLPEDVIQGTHYEEEPMLRRLDEFRGNNTEDNTMLNFFNEIEIHPMLVDVMTEELESMCSLIYEHLGPVVGFSQTPIEIENQMKCQAEVEELRLEQEKIQENILEIQLMEEHRTKMEKWTELLEQYQQEEEKIIVAQSEPLRNYLMSYVFPTLTQGLLEVANLKPNDPVDYLAEYLFRMNPEGRMYDPSYTRDGEYLQSESEILNDLKK